MVTVNVVVTWTRACRPLIHRLSRVISVPFWFDQKFRLKLVAPLVKRRILFLTIMCFMRGDSFPFIRVVLTLVSQKRNLKFMNILIWFRRVIVVVPRRLTSWGQVMPLLRFVVPGRTQTAKILFCDSHLFVPKFQSMRVINLRSLRLVPNRQRGRCRVTVFIPLILRVLILIVSLRVMELIIVARLRLLPKPSLTAKILLLLLKVTVLLLFLTLCHARCRRILI